MWASRFHNLHLYILECCLFRPSLYTITASSVGILAVLCYQKTSCFFLLIVNDLKINAIINFIV